MCTFGLLLLGRNFVVVVVAAAGRTTPIVYMKRKFQSLTDVI
jgi:hypothetical protein